MTKFRTKWVHADDRKKFDEIMRSVNPLNKRLRVLYRSICKTPFEGEGHPHKLTGNYDKWWSHHISGLNVVICNIDGDKLLFDLLDSFYHFTLDAAASKFNTLCPEFYSPQDDALTKPWNGKVFCHPPYSNKLGSWVKYAYKYIKPGSAAHE